MVPPMVLQSPVLTTPTLHATDGLWKPTRKTRNFFLFFLKSLINLQGRVNTFLFPFLKLKSYVFCHELLEF